MSTPNKRTVPEKYKIYDGLFRKNTLFVSGLVIAPVVVGSTTFRNSLVLAIAFSLITFFSVLISSFYPRKIVYTVRIILYTLTAAVVYVPVIQLINKYFHNEFESLGMYLPLLIVNSLIVSKTELRFFKRKKWPMLVDLTCCILGFDFAILFLGLFREVVSTGTINGDVLGINLTIPAFGYVFGGFILIGILSGIFRKIVSVVVSVVMSKE